MGDARVEIARAGVKDLPPTSYSASKAAFLAALSLRSACTSSRIAFIAAAVASSPSLPRPEGRAAMSGRLSRTSHSPLHEQGHRQALHGNAMLAQHGLHGYRVDLFSLNMPHRCRNGAGIEPAHISKGRLQQCLERIAPESSMYVMRCIPASMSSKSPKTSSSLPASSSGPAAARFSAASQSPAIPHPLSVTLLSEN